MKKIIKKCFLENTLELKKLITKLGRRNNMKMMAQNHRNVIFCENNL